MSDRISDASLGVLLVDDHELVRSALRLLLETHLGYDVVEASSGDEALRLFDDGSFDLVVLDVNMPGRDGLSTLSAIRERHASMPVVMLTHAVEEDAVAEAVRRGANGFVVKDASVDQLSESISTALSGRGLYLHPLAAEQLVAHRDRHAITQIARLTSRETDVLRMLAGGATNEEIGGALFITDKTVKTHLSAIFRKLGVTNRTQAATKAVAEGLLDD